MGKRKNKEPQFRLGAQRIRTGIVNAGLLEKLKEVQTAVLRQRLHKRIDEADVTELKALAHIWKVDVKP